MTYRPLYPDASEPRPRRRRIAPFTPAPSAGAVMDAELRDRGPAFVPTGYGIVRVFGAPSLLGAELLAQVESMARNANVAGRRLTDVDLRTGDTIYYEMTPPR